VHWDSFVEHVREDAGHALLAFDFDGTLAPIVEDPALADVDPRLARVLARLARHLPLAVISGRSQDFLAHRLAGIGATLVGNYGRSEVPSEEMAARLDRLAEQARAALGADVDLERKATSIALHYRRHPELAASVARFARQVQDREPGWDVAPGRMVIELLARDGDDKGTALDRLARGRGAVAYAGDDLADLAAFGVLARRPGPSCAIAIYSREMPEALACAADEVLTPDELAVRLEALAADLEPHSSEST
jgi:trehalose 6-phosphate phosphatase